MTSSHRWRSLPAGAVAALLTVGVVAALGARTPAGSGQSPQQEPAAPSFRAGVNYVRVDVLATDPSGKPIGDLRAVDFEVFEAGQLQTIETFKVVALDGGLMATDTEPPRQIRSDADEEREAARDDVRLFAIFLDDYHVKRASAIRVRDQLARFLDTQLGPSDLIGLMHPLDPIAAVQMGRNREAVRRGILSFAGRKHDYWPLTDEEHRYVFKVNALDVERIRNQVAFGAIKSLIVHLGAIKEGRKSLILVSEGYSDSLPLELQAYYGGLGAGAAMPRSQQQPVNMNLELQEIYNLANRNNVTIYPVDPRGLAAAEYGMDLPEVDRTTDRTYLTSTMDTLRALAENSDGTAIINRNDVTGAMKQIVIDSSAYYLIGYRSSLAVPDGKFHSIRVKVKRAGVSLRHRNGYWALTPEEAEHRVVSPSPAVTSPVAIALTKDAVPRSRIVRTWIGTERGDNDKTRVTFAWEPMPPLAGEPVRQSGRPVRIMMTVTGPDGSSYFRGAVSPAATPAGLAPASLVTFDAPPGRVRVRLSIEAATGDVLDSEMRDVVLPDFTSPRTLLGSPAVYRARSLPEWQRLKIEPRPLPAIARDFTATERLLLRVPVYGPGGVLPRLAATLVGRSGQTISTLAVAPPSSEGWAHEIELSLVSLPPGDYGIALTATGEAGDDSALVAFRVTP